jgi:hypothetical protein
MLSCVTLPSKDAQGYARLPRAANGEMFMLHRTPTFSHDFHASADAQSVGKVCSTLAKQERTFEGERR